MGGFADGRLVDNLLHASKACCVACHTREELQAVQLPHISFRGSRPSSPLWFELLPLVSELRRWVVYGHFEGVYCNGPMFAGARCRDENACRVR